MGPMTAAQAELAAEHHPRALRLVRRACQRWPTLADEFESAAMWACCLAAVRWRGRGAFTTYLHAMVHPVPLAVLRHRRCRPWEDRTSHRLDLLPAAAPRGRDPSSAVSDAFFHLTAIQAETVRRVHWGGESLRAIARSRGVQFSTVRKGYLAALERLRVALIGEI